MPEQRGTHTEAVEAQEKQSLLEIYPTEHAFIAHVIHVFESIDHQDLKDDDFEHLFNRILTRSFDGAVLFAEQTGMRFHGGSFHSLYSRHRKFTDALKFRLGEIINDATGSEKDTARSLDSLIDLEMRVERDPRYQSWNGTKLVEELRDLPEFDSLYTGLGDKEAMLQLYDEIDDYYAEVLRSRRPEFKPIKIERPNDIKSPGISIGERTLSDVERILSPRLGAGTFKKRLLIEAVPDFDDRLRDYYERTVKKNDDFTALFKSFESYKRSVVKGIPQPQSIPAELVDDILDEYGASELEQIILSGWGERLTEELAREIALKFNAGKSKDDPTYIPTDGPEWEKRIDECWMKVDKQFYTFVRGEGARDLKKEIRKLLPDTLELVTDEETEDWKIEEKEVQKDEGEQEVQMDREGETNEFLSFSESHQGESYRCESVEDIVQTGGFGKNRYAIVRRGGVNVLVFPHRENRYVEVQGSITNVVILENDTVVYSTFNDVVAHDLDHQGLLILNADIDGEAIAASPSSLRKSPHAPNSIEFAGYVGGGKYEFIVYNLDNRSVTTRREVDLGDHHSPPFILSSGEVISFPIKHGENYVDLDDLGNGYFAIGGEVRGVPWTDGTGFHFVVEGDDGLDHSYVYSPRVGFSTSEWNSIKTNRDSESYRIELDSGSEENFVVWYSKYGNYSANTGKDALISEYPVERGSVMPLVTEQDKERGIATTRHPETREEITSPPQLAPSIKEGHLKMTRVIGGELYYVVKSAIGDGEYVIDQNGEWVRLPYAARTGVGGVIKRLEERQGFLHYDVWVDGVLRSFMKPVGELIGRSEEQETVAHEGWYEFDYSQTDTFDSPISFDIYETGGVGSTSYMILGAENAQGQYVYNLYIPGLGDREEFTQSFWEECPTNFTSVSDRYLCYVVESRLFFVDTHDLTLKEITDFFRVGAGQFYLNRESNTLEFNGIDAKDLITVGFEDGRAITNLERITLQGSPEWFDNGAMVRHHQPPGERKEKITYISADGSETDLYTIPLNADVTITNRTGKYVIYTITDGRDWVQFVVSDTGLLDIVDFPGLVDSSISKNVAERSQLCYSSADGRNSFIQGYSDLGPFQLNDPELSFISWKEYETNDGDKGIVCAARSDTGRNIYVQGKIPGQYNTYQDPPVERGYRLGQYFIVDEKPVFVVSKNGIDDEGRQHLVDHTGKRIPGIEADWIIDIEHQNGYIKVVSRNDWVISTQTKKWEGQAIDVPVRQEKELTSAELRQLLTFTSDQKTEYPHEISDMGFKVIGGTGENIFLISDEREGAEVVFPGRERVYYFDKEVTHVYTHGDIAIFLISDDDSPSPDLRWVDLKNVSGQMKRAQNQYERIEPESFTFEGTSMSFVGTYLEHSRVDTITCRVTVDLDTGDEVGLGPEVKGRVDKDVYLVGDDDSPSQSSVAVKEVESRSGPESWDIQMPDASWRNTTAYPLVWSRDGKYLVRHVNDASREYTLSVGSGFDRAHDYTSLISAVDQVGYSDLSLGREDNYEMVLECETRDGEEKLFFFPEMLMLDASQYYREKKTLENGEEQSILYVEDFNNRRINKYVNGEHVSSDNVSGVFVESVGKFAYIGDTIIGVVGNEVIDSNGDRVMQFRFREDEPQPYIRSILAEDGYLHVVVEEVPDGHSGGKTIVYSKKLPEWFLEKMSAKKDKEPEVNTDVQRRLELLNILDKYNLLKVLRDDDFEKNIMPQMRATVDAYNEKYRPHAKKRDTDDPESLVQELKAEISEYLSSSPTFMQNIALTLFDDPKPFLETMAANPASGTQAQVDRFIRLVFPKYWEKMMRERYAHEVANYERRPEPTAFDYLTPQDFDGIAEADPEALFHQEVIQLREKIDRFIETGGLYGEYDHGTWRRTEIPVDPDLDEPVKQYTFTLPFVEGMREVVLPRILGAQIIPDRVKGIDSKGDEVSLTVETSPSGYSLVRLDGRKKFEKVVYSQRVSELPQAPTDISEKEHDRFRKSFEKQLGDAMTKRIGQLPPWAKGFVHSLEGKTPLEKIVAIESFVRSTGYYDFKNGEMQGQKQYKTFEERMSLMSYRLDELKNRDPELSGKLSKQQVAGVCADFGILTVALLREAGFAAGYIGGFRSDSETVTTEHAHGMAYVVWPNHEGRGYKVYGVDGTPGGVTEEEKAVLAHIQRPSIEQKAQEKQKAVVEIIEKSEEELARMQEELKEVTPDVIRKLKNGELERQVNTVLRYTVLPPETAVFRRLLSAGVYGPQYFREAGNEQEMKQFLESEVKSEHENPSDDLMAKDAIAGRYLFDLVKEYELRLTKQVKGVSESERRRIGLERFERMIEMVEDELSENELRAITAILTYLKAEQMASENGV